MNRFAALTALFFASTASANDIVYINGPLQYFPDAAGRYVETTAFTHPGIDACWTQQDGDNSLLRAGTYWYMASSEHCDLDPMPLLLPLDNHPSTDPLDTYAVDCEPHEVHVPNFPSAFGAQGDYSIASVTGDSEVACWNHEDGTHSMGVFYGHWYLISRPNCDIAQPYPAVIWFGAATTCDPTENVSFELGQ